VRLKGCLDEMRNILGESVPESVMVTAILRANFDSNAAADDVLGQQTQGSCILSRHSTFVSIQVHLLGHVKT